MVLGIITTTQQCPSLTRTIVHPCLDEITVTEVKQILNSLCKRNQSHKDLQGLPICCTDSDQGK